MYIYSCIFASLALIPSAFAKIQYLGVAIPGIDFGCDIDGTCPASTQSFPLSGYGGGDGEAQMKHFVKDSGVNTFRLPVSWQYLVNGKGGSTLDDTNFQHYDKLMQTCLDTGAYCMIDLHNFARYDNGIIGQGGPKDEVFVDLWKQIAQKYAKNDKIIFGLMNEPHDLDIKLWAQTCQKVVTGIRQAGATSQIILLPGTNFASAETFVSTGSAEALAAISNPDGSKDGLLLDLHKYLDINNSGTHKECTTDNVEGFRTISNWLRANKRLAMVSESGASMESSCMEKFCRQNEFISQNTDVIVGFVGWGAGSFDSNYVLTLTPLGSPGSYTDNKLMTECIINPFVKNTPPASTSSSASQTATSSTASSSASGVVTSTRAPTTTTATVSASPVQTSANSASSSMRFGQEPRSLGASIALISVGLSFVLGFL